MPFDILNSAQVYGYMCLAEGRASPRTAYAVYAVYAVYGREFIGACAVG